MIEQLLALAPSIHDDNVAKGFWEKGAAENQGERAMLILTELSEAVEGHRKNHMAGEWFTMFPESIESWCKSFETFIKNSIEDEIADTVIRILDYCTGFSQPILIREYRKESTGNFAEDVLRICWYVMLAHEGRNRDAEELQLWNSVHPGKDWGYVLAAIVELCKWYHIDLIQHIQWKLKYNRTRAHKHGKSY